MVLVSREPALLHREFADEEVLYTRIPRGFEKWYQNDICGKNAD